jgi:hypothetical protein
LVAAEGCDSSPSATDALTPPPLPAPLESIQTATLTATVGSTRFVTREHFLAAGEMQISGEPFAEQMQRQLSAYSRDHLPPDLYFDPSPGRTPWIDLPGFSTAVESYEYSKQPMNNVALESGAGTSLLYGPLANAANRSGVAALAALGGAIEHFALGSNALGRFVFEPGTFPVGGTRGGDSNAIGAGKPSENPLGWPGIWPTVHVFRSFDPTITPTSRIDLGCAISSDDDPGATGALGCADYECDATTLHLINRASQIEPILTPGADGFSAWKYGLWTLNYLQVMHDSTEAPVSSVADSDLPNVGSFGNQIIGADDTGAPTAAGTFLGSSDIEGFQAQMFIEEIDNRAEDWLMHFATADGQHLSGFSSLKDALAYDYTDPLRWFPGQIAVAESDDGSGFPRPGYLLESPDSDLLDELGLVLGYSEFYSLTDTNNVDVGGAQTAMAYFDGDPFPADDQLADGEPTLHDRALAMLRVALVNIDRLHTDAATGILIDDVKMSGATPSRGSTTTTTNVAYSILALRTALRSVSSQLELYSNNTPDTAISSTPIDALAVHPPTHETSFTARVAAMMNAEETLLYDHLTDESGRAYDGWNVATSQPMDQNDLLDAHTAAIRGLFAAYLTSGEVRYRDRALAVFNRMQSTFYDSGARIYSATPAPTDTVEYTPVRFALLQSALRDVYELVADRPGNEEMAALLESRVGRLNKLVLNGWDDRNQDQIVSWPDECVDMKAFPIGGLQMAERTLTGETGSYQENLTAGEGRSPTEDRERDCVPEIDDAQLPSALADSITFQISRNAP